MRIVTGLRALRRAPRRAVVTVGVFDGVHVAHQQLIRSTVAFARRLQGTSVVITFDPDPHAVLLPATAPPALMSVEMRLRHLQSLGVQWVIVLPFSKRFARMSAERFIQRILIGQLHAAVLIVGEAFVFGKNRLGNMDILRAIGPTHGMRVMPVESICRGGLPVSSSRIRRLIQQGKLAAARRLLGRRATLEGVVVRGAGRGRGLGFPTVNVHLQPQVLPPHGVYAVTMRIGPRQWRGVMNLGTRPTFGPGPVVCEVHLFGYAQTLHRASVVIALSSRLRGERRFSTPSALARQIQRDIHRARRILLSSSADPSTRAMALPRLRWRQAGRGFAQDSAPRVVQKVPRALPVGLH